MATCGRANLAVKDADTHRQIKGGSAARASLRKRPGSMEPESPAPTVLQHPARFCARQPSMIFARLDARS